MYFIPRINNISVYRIKICWEVTKLAPFFTLSITSSSPCTKCTGCEVIMLYVVCCFASICLSSIRYKNKPPSSGDMYVGITSFVVGGDHLHPAGSSDLPPPQTKWYPHTYHRLRQFCYLKQNSLSLVICMLLSPSVEWHSNT